MKLKHFINLDKPQLYTYCKYKPSWNTSLSTKIKKTKSAFKTLTTYYVIADTVISLTKAKTNKKQKKTIKILLQTINKAITIINMRS